MSFCLGPRARRSWSYYELCIIWHGALPESPRRVSWGFFFLMWQFNWIYFSFFDYVLESKTAIKMNFSMLLFDTPICYFQAPFLLLLSIFWWVYVNQSSNDLIFNDGCFISGLLVVSLNFRSSGLFMKILALLTICVFCLWLISLRCHSFKMLQHKEGQLYNQMMAWKQAPWASAVKCTFKDQIAIKRKETGGKKNSSASGTCETITKYLTSVSLESPAFDQQETEPAEAGESTRPFLEVFLGCSGLYHRSEHIMQGPAYS